MSMSGDLRTMGFADVLSFAGSRSGEAVISVESRQRRKEVRLACGRVVACTSGGVKERLGQRLIAGGRIHERILIASLAEQDVVGGRLGSILVRNRHIDDALLDTELDRQARASLADLFTWETGSFTLGTGDEGARLPPILDISCSEAILAGSERAAQARRSHAAVPDPTIRYRVVPSRYPKDFPRNALEAGVIRLLLSGLSPLEACLHRHEEDLLVLTTIAQLVEEGLLEPLGAGPVPPIVAPSEAIHGAAGLVARGRWDCALLMLHQAMLEHGDGAGLGVAAVRLRVKAREKLSWTGGLDVIPVAAPRLEAEGVTSLDGAERVVAARVDGSQPLRAIVRACPLDEDLATAAIAGLFERGMLQLRPRILTVAPGMPAASSSAPDAGTPLVGAAAGTPGQAEPIDSAAARRAASARLLRQREYEPPPSNPDAPRRR